MGKNTKNCKLYDEEMTNKLENGCPYRKWGWHDGGPEYSCNKRGGYVTCFDWYSDFVDEKKCRYRD